MKQKNTTAKAVKTITVPRMLGGTGSLHSNKTPPKTPPEKNLRTYDVFVHWKQGDDLCAHLEEYKDPVKALRSWAGALSKAGEDVHKLADAMEGECVEVFADTHCIQIHSEGAALNRKLDKLARTGLLTLE